MHIFVDEFQDTDPLQTEIFFRIEGAGAGPSRWQDVQLRAGSPCSWSAIPSRRSTGSAAPMSAPYAEARTTIERLWPDNVLAGHREFPVAAVHPRPRQSMLRTCLRRCRPARLRGPYGDSWCARPQWALRRKNYRGGPAGCRCRRHIRDSEARAVADLCHRLLTSLRVRGDDGALVPLTPGGIVLLAPTTTDLWRYERALEERDIPFASQAGRNLFRRQEVQDLLALARTLADPRDTMAFGALMRGPLVGLSEEELLDVAAALPADPDRPGEQPRFSISTNADQVSHPIARQALGILQELRRRVRSRHPSLLLAEAMERLMVRPVLASRGHAAHPRAVANVEAFLERAKPYNVRGLKAFVRDATRDWREGAPRTEGRVDSDGDAIQIMTVHGAKGLEWPVLSSPSTRGASSGGAIASSIVRRTTHCTGSLARSRRRSSWRRWRPTTKARHASASACGTSPVRGHEICSSYQNWAKRNKSHGARVLDLGCQDLPVVDPPRGGTAAMVDEAPPANTQSQEVFAAERAKIAEAAAPLAWLRPSAHDADRAAILKTAPPDGLADAPGSSASGGRRQDTGSRPPQAHGRSADG